MKLKIAKKALLEGLQNVQNVVGLRSTIPILSNVMFTAQKGKLLLCTTDLEVSVRCGVEATIVKPGATTLPARRLASIVRELPESSIDIEVDDKNVALFTCESSYFKIVGMDEEEFPPMSKPEGQFTYRLETKALKEMLSLTGYAASADETRHVLNGALLCFKGNTLSVVATDGRRLAMASREIDVPKGAEAEVILPTKAIAELMHTLPEEGEVSMQTDGGKITFEFGDIFIATKVIEGTFPNFKQVIPASCEESIAIERETLLTSLRRVSLLTTDKSNVTKLTFQKNKLEVSTVTPDVGEARESMAIK
jgi:DNA polymerase-3 subunit beta